jgi:hypothetical protein
VALAPDRREIRLVHSEPNLVDNEVMTETASMINREIRCRCGQVGVISGVEGSEDNPDLVWVTHLVRLAMQTHIHRKAQMPAVLAQL